MTTILTVIVACTLENYVRSNCVPPELLKMEIEYCYYGNI